MMLAALLVLGQLVVPAEVRGEVAEFVTIIGTTEGKVVRYVALDQGLQVFPSSLLVNQRATVVTSARPGRYRLLAYTSVADVPTEPVITTVIIGGASPPSPPSPPSPIVDPLADALGGIYGGSQERDKAATLARLLTLYRAAPATIRSPTITTTEQLYAAMVMARKNAGIADAALSPVRERIATEWVSVMGSDDRALTPDLRDAAITLSARILAALEVIR
jgi:hypothetical protein